MKYSDVSMGGTYEILATNNYNAIPITVAAPASGTIVKAGTPLTLAGAAALDGTSAHGILLYDVDTAVNPNAALVVSGVVDWAKCVELSGATATAAEMQAILPAIEFRDNIRYIPPATITDTITLALDSTAVKLSAYSGTATLKYKAGSVIPGAYSDVSTWTTAAQGDTLTGVSAGGSVVFAQVNDNGLVIAAIVKTAPST